MLLGGQARPFWVESVSGTATLPGTHRPGHSERCVLFRLRFGESQRDISDPSGRAKPWAEVTNALSLPSWAVPAAASPRGGVGTPMVSSGRCYQMDEINRDKYQPSQESASRLGPGHGPWTAKSDPPCSACNDQAGAAQEGHWHRQTTKSAFQILTGGDSAERKEFFMGVLPLRDLFF